MLSKEALKTDHEINLTQGQRGSGGGRRAGGRGGVEGPRAGGSQSQVVKQSASSIPGWHTATFFGVFKQVLIKKTHL